MARIRWQSDFPLSPPGVVTTSKVISTTEQPSPRCIRQIGLIRSLVERPSIQGRVVFTYLKTLLVTISSSLTMVKSLSFIRLLTQTMKKFMLMTPSTGRSWQKVLPLTTKRWIKVDVDSAT